MAFWTGWISCCFSALRKNQCEVGEGEREEKSSASISSNNQPRKKRRGAKSPKVWQEGERLGGGGTAPITKSKIPIEAETRAMPENKRNIFIQQNYQSPHLPETMRAALSEAAESRRQQKRMALAPKSKLFTRQSNESV
jgi:hypothetical protein